MLKEANDRGLRNFKLAKSIQQGSILAGYDLEKDLREIQERNADIADNMHDYWLHQADGAH
jgi:hypothetical protein